MRPWPAMVFVAALLAGCGGGGGDPGGGPGGGPSPSLSATLMAPANLVDERGATMALAASATGSVAAVEFEIDGVVAASDSSAPHQASVAAADYAAGQHVVRARARDAAGNVSAWSSATVRFGSAAAPAGFVRDTSFVRGLTDATAFAQAPDGRLFIAEQGGALRVVKNGALLATPFVQLGVDVRGERGLIGIALDPAFASNGFVYLHYTATVPSVHNRISRFNAAGDVAQAASEVVLLDLPPLSAATNHNGGAIHFGADGRLYIGIGDNANSMHAQDVSDPFGKLLRLNPDGSIPSDNPFAGTGSGLGRAVWAYGLRNPFTFAVQPGSGRIHINDVGDAAWEEIDVGAAGANYGWPLSEGPVGVGAGQTAPLFAYAHADANPLGSGPGGFFTGLAITGGAFYPATATLFQAPYRGDYFFADLLARFVGRLDLDNDNAAYAFGRVDDDPVDMLVGNDGALLVLTRSGVTRFAR